MRNPKPYCSECLVTKIKKKQKSCWKHLNRLWEIRLQILKIWRFSLAFTNSVSNQYFLNHLCVYSCMVPTNMLISTFLKEIYSPLQSISQKSTSNVIIISQSRCATLRQLYNLIHHELVYNLSLLLSFGIWFSVELKQSLIIAHLTKSWRLDVTGRQWRRLVLSAVKLNQIFHTVNMKKAHNNDQKGINPPHTHTHTCLPF